jgi:DNA-binding transcriptional LysR family regulator
LGLNAQRGNDLAFDSQLLFNERLFLLFPASDPLAQHREVRLRQLARREFIHSVRSGSVWQQMQPMLAPVGVSDSGLEVTQFSTLAGLVANGFGISVVPQFAVRLRQRSLSVAATAMWEQLLQAGKTAVPVDSSTPSFPRRRESVRA